MLVPLVLSFAGGVLIGFLAAVLVYKLFRLKFQVVLNPPTINTTVCQSDGRIRIEGTVAAAVENLTLARLFTRVDDTNPTSLGNPVGALCHPPAASFTLYHPQPVGLQEPNYLLVWAEYHGFTGVSSELPTPCSGSGSGGSGGPSGSGSGCDGGFAAATHAVSLAAARQLEAVPRAYRVSPGTAAGETPGGAVAGLVGALVGPPETVLRYVAEESTPVEPFWRAVGDAEQVREWTLALLHRNGGFGAVLSADCRVAGREVRLTWVTSDWRFHAENRLLCESDEARNLSLLVRPA